MKTDNLVTQLRIYIFVIITNKQTAGIKQSSKNMYRALNNCLIASHFI